MLKVCLIKTSVGSRAEAEQLARSLLEAGLVACVGISAAGISLYHWQGELQCEDEFYLTLKTTPAQREAVMTYLNSIHPYDLPELIWAEFDASEQYGEWVEGELSASERGER